ncbi:MAG TPA: LCP family protein [Ktedonobacteraceae bacterium]|jgi:LCP family protein required for cell wall assembly
MNRNVFPPENDPARPSYDRQWGGYEQTRKPYQYPGSPTDWREPHSETPVYQPTLPAAGFARQQGRAQPRRRRRRGCTIGCLGTLVILLVLAIFFFVTAQRVLAFGSAISNQSPLSTQNGYMGGSQRVNFLIMGYGGSGHDGAYLTDSLVVISLLPQSHHTTLISVPRDLWVQNPANSGNYSKINTVYTLAAQNNANPIAGGNAVAQKISLITGLRIDYWLTINFTGFKDFIDAVGGIDVNVPDSFTAKYPASDDPAVNPNWITVTFKKGQQHMDGQRAIIYARARYVLDNPAEGSDFARSQRQQLIMKAALTRIKQWQTWPHMFGALDKLQHTLYANLSLADLAEFALKMDLNAAHRAGLSNANVLADATSDDGQAILLPQNNNWALIPAYIQKQLYT